MCQVGFFVTPFFLVLGSAAAGAAGIVLAVLAMDASSRRTATDRDLRRAGARAGAAFLMSIVFAGIWALLLVASGGFILRYSEPLVVGPMALTFLSTALSVWAMVSAGKARKMRRIEEDWLRVISNEAQTTYITWGPGGPSAAPSSLPQLPPW